MAETIPTLIRQMVSSRFDEKNEKNIGLKKWEKINMKNKK